MKNEQELKQLLYSVRMINKYLKQCGEERIYEKIGIEDKPVAWVKKKAYLVVS